MDVLNQPLVILLLSALAGVLGFLGAQALSKLDFAGIGVQRMAERMNAAETRMTSMEEDRSKIADALERLTRLEERQDLAKKQLDEAHETSKAVVQLAEQMKTAFKRLDEVVTAVSSWREDAPRETARQLYAMLRG